MKIGEIIETSATEFTGQAYSYDSAPAFGSFAETSVNGDTVTGVVTEVFTSPLDPSRRPSALGDENSSLADTVGQYPQLDQLIHTYFKVRITHVNGTCTVPAKPPRLHEGVTACTDKKAKTLMQSPAYLASLTDASDEVLAKHLAYIASVDSTAVVSAGKTINTLLKDDYVRLQRVMRAV